MKTFLTVICSVAAIACNAQQGACGRTVYFKSGKSDLAAADLHWIDSVAAVLNDAAGYKINIKAYCDADGSDTSNDQLAAMRAEAVKNSFAYAKMEKGKITAAAFGEHDPVADNATQAGKAKNRRAVIAVTYTVKKEETAEKTIVAGPVTFDETAAAHLVVGERLVIKNLNFEGGSSVLLDESVPALQQLLKLMTEHPGLEIEIGGHVCCGADMPLSVARAKRVYEYLSNRGVSTKRMTYKGYSFDKPVADESTEDGKKQNRRVEITIMKM